MNGLVLDRRIKKEPERDKKESGGGREGEIWREIERQRQRERQEREERDREGER